MFDTINIGTTALLTHAKGLRVVGNNLANVNTPGFKSSQLQFSDLFEQGGGASGSAKGEPGGTGTTSLGNRVNFNAGLDQSTGNPLDLSIAGNGFYAVQRGDDVLYTRSGDFRFNDQGMLVNGAGDTVLGLDDRGGLVPITLTDLERNLPAVSTAIKVTGNLTSTVASPPINAALSGIKVFDQVGGSHTLNLSFKDNGGGNFTVTVNDAAGGPAVATGNIKFASGQPVAGSNSFKFTYSPAGVAPFDLVIDFSGAQSLASSTSLAATKDGYGAGVRTGQSIDSDGSLKVTYSNGKSAKGTRLALANFASEDDLQQTGGGAFRLRGDAPVTYGYAGTGSFGTLLAGHREGSNVDLAEEFSNLILMQRGYQAASHVISTANDMIQQLFDMKGNR